MTYQPPAVWSQPPITFYQNTPPSGPQRYQVSIPSQAPYMSASYPPSFIPQPNQAIQPNPSSSEVVPVYPQQQLQVVYSPQNQPIYPNQNIVYAQNPLYNNGYQAQGMSYPQCSSASSSCTNTPAYCQQIPPENIPQTYSHLTQSMANMNIASPPSSSGQKSFPMLQYDCRNQKVAAPKGKPLKSFGSSQSSTGTSSPAGTVICAYNNPGPGLYRTPPETPPTPHMAGYPPNFLPPMLMRQVIKFIFYRYTHA